MRGGGPLPYSGSPAPANAARIKYAAARKNLAIELFETTALTVEEMAEWVGVTAETIREYLR